MIINPNTPGTGSGKYLPLTGGELTGPLTVQGTNNGRPVLLILRSDLTGSVGLLQTDADQLMLAKTTASGIIGGNARLMVATPTGDDDAANKGYVDKLKPKAQSIIIDWDSWVGQTSTSGEPPVYVATIPVFGVLADPTAQLIQVMPDSDSINIWRTAGVRCVSQAADALTFEAGSLPRGEITCYAVMQEVDMV